MSLGWRWTFKKDCERLVSGRVFAQNITRRDTLKEDHLAKTYQKNTRHDQGATLNAARSSKSILTWLIIDQLFNISYDCLFLTIYWLISAGWSHQTLYICWMLLKLAKRIKQGRHTLHQHLGVAIIVHIRTTIIHAGIRQPWTTVTTLLGLISMAQSLVAEVCFKTAFKRQLHITKFIAVVGNSTVVLPRNAYCEMDPVTSDLSAT